MKKIEVGFAVTIPQATLLGAALIGASIVVSRLFAPYEIAGSGGGI